MGLTDRGRMRVTNLKELIYKSGQQHVSRATVSLQFNNKDASKSPIGYEDKTMITVTRQILATGTSKYLINGRQRKQADVHDLFQSVSLNVNQPHFLVMQGKIAQILGMRAPQIMGLLEEAAGTKMFETKKEQSAKIIAQKQKKISEIEDIIKTDIQPRLETLREQKALYARQQNSREAITELKKTVKVQAAMHARADLDAAQEREREAGKTVMQVTEDIEATEAVLAEVTKELDELTCGGDDAAALNAARTSLREAETALDKLKDAEKAAREEHARLETVVRDTQKNIDTGRATAEQDAKALETARAEAKTAGAAAAQAMGALERLKAANDARETGVVMLDGGSTCSRAQRIAQLAQGTVEAKGRIAGLEREGPMVEAGLTAAREELDRATSGQEVRQAAVDKARAALQAAEAQHGTIDTVRATLDSTTRELASVRTDVDRLESTGEGAGLFSYVPPRDPRFDAGKVHGALAELVQPKEAHQTALEVTAGRKLFNVVTDDFATAKLLIKNKSFTQRTTFLPNDKIAAKRINPELPIPVGCTIATESVTAPDNVRKVVGHVWGDVVICEDGNTAAVLAGLKKGGPKIKGSRPRTVTVGGELFNPTGVMVGGSRTKASVFAKLGDMRARSARLNEGMARLGQLQARVDELRAALDLLDGLRAALEEATAAAENTAATTTQGEIDALTARKVAIQGELQAAQHELTAIATETAALEGDGGLDTTVAEADAQAMQKAADRTARRAADLAGVVAGRAEDLADLEAALHEARAGASTAGDNAADIGDQRATAEALVTDRMAAVEAMDSQAATRIGEAASLTGRRRELTRAATQGREALETAEERLRQARKDVARKQDGVKANRTRIPDGVEMVDKATLETMAAELSDQEEVMGKAVDPGVVSQADRLEADWQELTDRRETVMDDKAKIEAVIEDLDGKKRETLQETLAKVSTEFGIMLGIMLPGAGARLDVVGGDLSKGAEIKVSLGGVWKQSLTELSGGQRSLCALALILALLKIRPAPLYILDEIDAALDLNNTQNIGTLIRERFQEAQFIVVSLKEAMFDNANVLYRVRFEDGSSRVGRHANV